MVGTVEHEHEREREREQEQEQEREPEREREQDREHQRGPSRSDGGSGTRDGRSGEERVVLVDEQDRAVGTLPKLAAHRDGGRLHRAFSIFLFDEEGRMLLQQRAQAKYHFPLLWTNACCGHPRPGEDVVEGARRRLREELGVEAGLRRAFAFVYAAEDAASGLTEREYDHVLVGRLETQPRPAPEEVAALERRAPDELLRDVAARPGRYTPWFRQALPQLESRGLLAEASAGGPVRPVGVSPPPPSARR